MIDIDFEDVKHLKVNDVPFLILENPHVRNYCTVTGDWIAAIRDVHENLHVLDYRDLFRALGQRGLEDYLKEYIRKHEIKIIYILELFLCEFSLEFIEELRNSCFIFSFFGDVFEHFENRYRYLAQALDLVFVDDYYDKFKFKTYGIDSLLMVSSHDVNVYRDFGKDKKKDIDISFVGRMDRIGRKEYIDVLTRHGFKVEVYGAGSQNGLVSREKMIEILNSSKINLNFTGISCVVENKVESRIKQLKGRCQEVALTNSFVLSQDAPCMERLFHIGSEIDVFYNEDELLRKVNFYLENDEIRERMARKVYARAKEDYDSRKVWKKLLQLIYKKAQDKRLMRRPVFLSGFFSSAVDDSRIRYFFSFLKDSKMKLAGEQAQILFLRDRLWFFRMIFIMVHDFLRSLLQQNPNFKKMFKKLLKK